MCYTIATTSPGGGGPGHCAFRCAAHRRSGSRRLWCHAGPGDAGGLVPLTARFRLSCQAVYVQDLTCTAMLLLLLHDAQQACAGRSPKARQPRLHSSRSGPADSKDAANPQQQPKPCDTTQAPGSDADQLAAIMAAAALPPLAASEVAEAAAATDIRSNAQGEGLAPAAPAGAAGAPLGQAADAAGTTQYARSRPRREAAGSRRAELGDTSESLTLVPCAHFVGAAGSRLPGSQPYAVSVDLQVGCW